MKYGRPPSQWFPELSGWAALLLDIECLIEGQQAEKDAERKRGSDRG